MAQTSDGLKVIARKKGMLFGAAVRLKPLTTDPRYAAAITRECSVITAENDLKWHNTEKVRGAVDYGWAESIYAFAKQNRILMRGHTLVWENALPDFVQRDLNTIDPATLRRIVQGHITDAAEHWKGRLYQWDVVNEYLKQGGGGVRRSDYWDKLGIDFIADAFKTLQSIDPKCSRVYNDYGFGMSVLGIEVDALLRLLDDLSKRGAQVNAIGVQAHVATGRWINQLSLRRLAKEIGDRNMTLVVTELDVKDTSLAPDDPDRDQKIADTARAYVEPLFEGAALKGIVTWGIADRYTWLNENAKAKRQDGGLTRGLPLDADFKRKAMWFALYDLFRQATPR